MWFRCRELKSKEIFKRTRGFHYCMKKDLVNKRVKQAVALLTDRGVAGLRATKMLANNEEENNNRLTLANNRVTTNTTCELNMTRK